MNNSTPNRKGEPSPPNPLPGGGNPHPQPLSQNGRGGLENPPFKPWLSADDEELLEQAIAEDYYDALVESEDPSEVLVYRGLEIAVYPQLAEVLVLETRCLNSVPIDGETVPDIDAAVELARQWINNNHPIEGQLDLWDD